MIYATPGTVSWGTMRNQDLSVRFSALLLVLAQANHNAIHTKLAEVYDTIKDFDSAEASYYVQELFEALNDYAPPNHYFGASIGDGSDYGYWSLDDV